MRCKVVLHHSDEGVSASVPGLPGCRSQGADDQDALKNIRSAIQEYLAVAVEQTKGLTFGKRGGKSCPGTDV
jgi:predicted RNase H-like HicB family nuclease